MCCLDSDKSILNWELPIAHGDFRPSDQALQVTAGDR
jgi:hypothetical protein